MEEINSSYRPSWWNKVSKWMINGMQPFLWLTNRFLSTFRTTTLEEKTRLEDPCYERYVILSFLLPAYIICIILYAPIAMVCYVVWITVQSGQPCFMCYINNEFIVKKPSWTPNKPFTMASINTYLMPEFSARYYNLGNTQKRADKIAEIVLNPEKAGVLKGIDNKALDYDSDSDYEYRIDQDLPPKKETLHKISAQFPNDLDLVCLQGVFENRAHIKLMEKLRTKFPCIVYNCAVNTWKTNRYRWPSGLMIASRWPVVGVCFKPFSASCAWDKNICKGALIVKTELNTASDQKVAFIVNTHLQEGYSQDAVQTRDRQLNELQEFVEYYCKPTNSDTAVSFNIICGHLGFDNISSGVRINQNHNLYTKYIDPFRISSGIDTKWSIGTQLIQHKIHKDDVATPDNLKRCLETKEVHKDYLESCQMVTEEENDKTRRGRKRVNHTLVTTQTIPDVEAQQSQVVQSITYTTALAGLTLHIPHTLAIDGF